MSVTPFHFVRNHFDILRLRPLRSSHQDELNPLALSHCLGAFGLYCREMNVHNLAVLASDEAVSLGGVRLFHRASFAPDDPWHAEEAKLFGVFPNGAASIRT